MAVWPLKTSIGILPAVCTHKPSFGLTRAITSAKTVSFKEKTYRSASVSTVSGSVVQGQPNRAASCCAFSGVWLYTCPICIPLRCISSDKRVAKLPEPKKMIFILSPVRFQLAYGKFRDVSFPIADAIRQTAYVPDPYIRYR